MNKLSRISPHEVLKEKRGVIYFFSLKKGGGGGLFEMGSLIEDLRYAKFVEELEVKKAEEFVVHRREILVSKYSKTEHP